MKYFSNYYFFPIVQALLLAVVVVTLVCDGRLRSQRRRSPVGAVNRGAESMNAIDKFTGAVIALVITIINKAVFDEDKTWSHYAAFFDLANVLAILYLGYLSPWMRNKIIGLQIRLKSE
jgi:hypothetical protein